MYSAEEFLGRWQGGEDGRQAVRRYLELAFGAGLGEADLYRQEMLDVFRVSPFGGGEQAILSFLELLAALRPDLHALGMPSLHARVPRLTKTYRCAPVAQFLGKGHPAAEGELRLGAALLALRLERDARDLTAQDFAQADAITACAGRLKGQSAGPHIWRAAYRFYRRQLESAGVAATEQELWLMPLVPAPELTMPPGVSPTLAAFVEFQRGQGLATWQLSARELRLFEEWAVGRDPGLVGPDGQIDPQLLTEQHVSDYRSYLLGRVALGTRNARLSRLRRYLRWLLERGLIGPGVLCPLERVSKRQQHEVTVWELPTLLAFRDAWVRTSAPLFRAALGLMASNGGRVSEVRRLRLQDLDIGPEAQVRYYGKGRGSHERWVPVVSERVLQDLRAYLAERPVPVRPREEALFLLQDGRPLSARALRREFRRLCAVAGIEGRWTAMVLRRTVATTLCEEGVDILVRAEILGHQDLRSQESYVKNDFQHAAARLKARLDETEAPAGD